MKIICLIVGLGLALACNKHKKNASGKDEAQSANPTVSGEAWTGRSDFSDANWQIKSQR